jgi:hypothetical protein
MGQTSSGVPHHDVPAGIEKLYQADGAATLARDLKGFDRTVDEDAVLLQPGQASILAKTAFEESVKQNFDKSPSAKVLKYAPDIRGAQVGALSPTPGAISIRPSSLPRRRRR